MPKRQKNQSPLPCVGETFRSGIQHMAQMKDRLTIPFNNYGLNTHHIQERYIHKYYLPLELKRRIRPADILAFSFLDRGEDRIDLRKGVIPLEMPDVIIFYPDIELERTVSSVDETSVRADVGR